MQRIKTYISKLPQNWEIILLFLIFITFALFLGDGIQPLVDVYLGICVILLYIYSIVIKKIQLQISRPLFLPWFLLLGYLTIRTLFSDSVALSIWATMRVYLAFLVFVLFNSILKNGGKEFFIKGLTLVSIFAICISFIFIIFPHTATPLPPMNLLYASWGHNHLPALLLFTFPYVYHRALNQKSNATRFILILYLFAIAISFSKSALLVILLYFGFNSVISFIVKTENRLKIIHVLFFLSTIIILLLILILGRIFTSQALPLASYSNWFRRQAVKPIDFYDVRGLYWQQAIDAFRDSPLFGHGSGTFYLLSKRYQQAPNQYSYFAHSWPLELLAELGITGLFLLAFLVYKILNSTLIFTRQFPQPTTHNPQLLIGIFLVLGLSLIDFNLNFLIIWLMLFAFLGSLVKTCPAAGGYRPRFNLIPVALITLGLFCLLSLTSTIISSRKTPNSAKLAFYLAPFDTRFTINYLETDILSGASNVPRVFTLISFLHQNDPEVNFALAQQYKQISFTSAAQYYVTALRQYPKNITYHASYLTFLAEGNTTEGLKNEVLQLGQEFLPENFRDHAYSLLNSFSDTNPEFFLPQANFLTVNQVRLWIAKTYYLYGLSTMKISPGLTESLWILARDLNPTLSYYHIEIASLAINIFHDSGKSLEALMYCQRYIQAKKHCSDLINNNFHYVPNDYFPGFLEKNIREFPLE